MIALSLKIDIFFSSFSRLSIIYHGPTPLTTIVTFGSNSALLSGVVNRYNAFLHKDRGLPDKPKIRVRVARERDQARYWSAYPTLKKLGIPVKVENTVAKLHHKVGIIDKKKVILGSYNWTFTHAFVELWEDVLVE